MQNSAEARSLMDDVDFLLELDKIGNEEPRVEPVRRPGFWAAQQRLADNGQDGPDGQDGRDGQRLQGRQDRRDANDGPDWQERRRWGQEHVAELPRAASTLPAPLGFAAGGDARVEADEASVPRRLAALVILLGMCAGAGGAVLLFHDRVEQIVTAWTLTAR